MIMRQFGKVLRPFVMLSMLLSAGCAQQMKSVQPDAGPETRANSELRTIKVADDASRIEIVSERPIVYTYYMLDAPPRLIVDLAQVTPGKVAAPMEVNKGNVKRIDVSKHEFSSGILSRIEVLMADKVTVVAELDPKDNNRLVINVPLPFSSPTAGEGEKKSPADQQSLKQEVETVAASDPTPKVDAGSREESVPQEPAASKAVDPGQSAVVVASATKPLKTGEHGLTAILKKEMSIQLEIAGPVESFRAFRLNQPERLVIDVPKTGSALDVKIADIDRFNIGKARIGGSPDKLRIVFDATGAIPPYKVVRNDSGLSLDFGENSRSSQAANTEAVNDGRSSSSAVTNNTIDKSLPGTVDALEFVQTDGISRITVKTSGRCSSGQPVKTARGYSLALKDCRLPVKLQRQLDTRGFASVIKNIAPISIKGKIPETRIAVNLRGTLPNSLKQENGTLQWEFTEPASVIKSSRADKTPKISKASRSIEDSAEASESSRFDRDIQEARQMPQKSGADKAMEEAFVIDSSTGGRAGKVYTGRKVTLEFSDADIGKIFQLLAEVSNQNILVSDDVTGKISLKLVNVPWDQALDVILENKGLGMKREGNIVQIRPKTKMKSLDDEAVDLRIAEEKKMPLSTVIFDVNFSSLSEIEKQFKQLASRRSDASVSGDARTNKVIVVDIEPNIKKMRALLQSIDVPEKQVMIEARIVEAESTFARDIGVKWNFGYQDGSASNANINNITSSMGGVVSPVLPTTTTGGIAAGMAFGKLLSNVQLDMRLSAAATIGQLKIIATPKVMTVNNKAAKISQGQMIPYQNTSSTEGAKTEFIEAALSLEVTPHITADGSVSMKIKASNNTAGTGNPPPINKKEATTELVVKNGETTVIGGIYVDRETEGETGIPYISEIPLLGWLFKSNSKGKTKNELLIFITPKIIS